MRKSRPAGLVSGVATDSGLSGGDAQQDGVSVWLAGSYSGNENTSASNGFDGHVFNLQTGMDFEVSPRLITGLSVGSTTIKLKNVGTTGGKYDEHSYSVVPYAQYQIDDMVTLGALAGYAFGDVDQTNGATGATSNTNSSMWFMAARGGMDVDVDELTQVTTRFGASYMSKGINGFTDSSGNVNASVNNNKTYSLSIGSEARRKIVIDSGVVVPYLGADYMLDFKDRTNNDKDALMLSTGMRADFDNGFYCTLDFSSQLGRTDYSSWTAGGRAGINF